MQNLEPPPLQIGFTIYYKIGIPNNCVLYYTMTTKLVLYFPQVLGFFF
jgi:hypothetical protein